MRPRKLIWKIIRTTNVDKIVASFLGFVCIFAVLMWIVEPGIKSIGDAFWYAFSVISTIGFGDIISVTALGRVLSIILGIYAIFVVALVPGVVVSYFQENIRLKSDSSTATYLYKLEHLDELSKEELAELSAKIRKKG